MSLTHSLRSEQLEAANRIHSQLSQWRLSDEALKRLCEDYPGFNSAEVCLLKCVALNSLYGTQVLAIIPLALKIYEKLSDGLDSSLSSPGAEILVREIAEIKLPRAKKDVIRTSFAAKFCHFFISDRLFYIYDEAAKKTLKFHLGPRNLERDQHAPYSAFCKNITKLRKLGSIDCEGRELDRYLWLTGTCMKWLERYDNHSMEKEAEINKELHNFLVSANKAQLNDLRHLLPLDIFERIEVVLSKLNRKY